MFDYYRFRFSMFKGWEPEFGYELMAPAGIFGVALILWIIYLTSPDFGFLMWRWSVPLPAMVAIGIVLYMLVVTYIADDMKRVELWVVLCSCVAALIAIVPLTLWLSGRYEQGFYEGMPQAPSSMLIGTAFATYLFIMLMLTVSRLRESADSG